MHAFDGRTDRQTDRQTDRIPIAIPRLHSMQRGKNYTDQFLFGNTDKLPRSMFRITLYDDVSSLSVPNFTILNLVVHPEQSVELRHLCRRRKYDQ